MVEVKEASQRRVYVLPAELVERVVEFQRAKNLPSEVEAVRRLLDEALKHRDTGDAIVQRMVDRVTISPLTADAARDILIGHPLLTSLSFQGETVVFELKGFGTFKIRSDGKAFEKNRFNDNKWEEWPVEVPF